MRDLWNPAVEEYEAEVEWDLMLQKNLALDPMRVPRGAMCSTVRNTVAL